MLQFGSVTYNKTIDYEKSIVFLNEFKKDFRLTYANHQLIVNAVESNPTIGKALLIYVRLFFWKLITLYDLIPLIKDRVNYENYNNLGIFEKNELQCCLGHELLCAFLGEKIQAFNEITNPNRYPDIVGDSSDASEVWTYIPPPTGFFSIIENILYAKFYCRLRNKIFKLDINHNWWQYPIQFLNLFDDDLRKEFNLDLPSDMYLTWDVLRFGMNKISHEEYQELAEFKFNEYKKIKNTLNNFFSKIKKPNELAIDGCVVYIRGGDKIVLETIQSPPELLRHDLMAVQALKVPIFFLSDDFKISEGALQLYGDKSSRNITKSIFHGYHYGHNNSEEDFYAIIENYLILASCRYSISCPSSNLVNSAHWSNQKLKTDFNLWSIPTYRYLYL